MRTIPARKSALSPEFWIPIESLEGLPEMEELLNPSRLVESGQHRAIRLDDDGQRSIANMGTVAKMASPTPGNLQKHEARRASHRRWKSKRRTLHLKRKARVQKVLFGVVGVSLIFVLISGATSFFTKTQAQASPVANYSSAPSFIPSKVDLVIEGKQTQVLSVANSLEQFKQFHNLVGLAPMQQRFERIDAMKRSAPALEFRYAKVITINVDSTTKTILSTDLTVGQALKNSGLEIDGDDIVSVALATNAKDVKNISISRVSTTTRTAQVSIPFSVINQNDSTLAKGKTSIKQTGVNGLADVVYSQTLQDGKVSAEVETSRHIIKAPVSQIVSVGTKPLGTESGKASWYAHTPGTCAHKILPFGTIVTVRNSNTGATTTCRVADRGPFGAGRIIDLTKDVFARIASISQGIVPVTISW